MSLGIYLARIKALPGQRKAHRPVLYAIEKMLPDLDSRRCYDQFVGYFTFTQMVIDRIDGNDTCMVVHMTSEHSGNPASKLDGNAGKEKAPVS